MSSKPFIAEQGPVTSPSRSEVQDEADQKPKGYHFTAVYKDILLEMYVTPMLIDVKTSIGTGCAITRELGQSEQDHLNAAIELSKQLVDEILTEQPEQQTERHSWNVRDDYNPKPNPFDVDDEPTVGETVFEPDPSDVSTETEELSESSPGPVSDDLMDVAELPKWGSDDCTDYWLGTQREVAISPEPVQLLTQDQVTAKMAVSMLRSLRSVPHTHSRSVYYQALRELFDEDDPDFDLVFKGDRADGKGSPEKDCAHLHVSADSAAEKGTRYVETLAGVIVAVTDKLHQRG